MSFFFLSMSNRNVNRSSSGTVTASERQIRSSPASTLEWRNNKFSPSRQGMNPVFVFCFQVLTKSWLPAMLTISPLISVCTDHLNSKLLDRSEANVPEGMLVKLAVFRVAKLLKRIYPSQIIAGCKEQSMDSCAKPSISTTRYWTEEIVKHAFGKENTYIFLW